MQCHTRNTGAPYYFPETATAIIIVRAAPTALSKRSQVATAGMTIIMIIVIIIVQGTRTAASLSLTKSLHIIIHVYTIEGAAPMSPRPAVMGAPALGKVNPR